MKLKEIVFATNNPNKIKEAKHFFSNYLVIKSLAEIGCTEDIPETKQTIEENAIQKSRYVYDNYGTACFSDDSGLEITALDRAPGVLSARYAGYQKSAEDNMNKVLKNMESVKDRSAQFLTVIAYADSPEVHCFKGVLEGVITTEKIGNKGFGYDPIFIPKGYNKTFAQMSLDQKNLISHRALAFKAFKAFIQHT